MKKVLFIFGTRPEAIKLAPVFFRTRESKHFLPKICTTSQHKELLKQVIDFFHLPIDFNLKIMNEDQSLFYLTKECIHRLEKVIESENPEVVIVQGDATTALAGAISAFYKKIPVAHIEAGLRTEDKYEPFPEEVNRKLISQIADYHFAPTERAAKNLLTTGIEESKIFVVGNTVIDAQNFALEYLRNNEEEFYKHFNKIDFNKRILLVTVHRRESFGKPLESICDAISTIASNFEDIEIIIPLHPNPNVQKVCRKMSGKERIHIFPPLDYPKLIFILQNSFLILTDSGGIQEEAPSFGKPVLVLRNKTERVESLELGISKLVGTNKDNIVEETSLLLNDFAKYSSMARKEFPYGNGNASRKIVEILENLL